MNVPAIPMNVILEKYTLLKVSCVNFFTIITIWDLIVHSLQLFVQRENDLKIKFYLNFILSSSHLQFHVSSITKMSS
jgi:hypothetical protein